MDNTRADQSGQGEPMSWCTSCCEMTPFDGTSICPVCGYDHDAEGDRICKDCDGTGGDKYSDGIIPCENCNGTGIDPYYW